MSSISVLLDEMTIRNIAQIEYPKLSAAILSAGSVGQGFMDQCTGDGVQAGSKVTLAICERATESYKVAIGLVARRLRGDNT